MNYQEHNLLLVNSPNMSFYREKYKNSPLWDGKKPLSGRRVIVYGCQGHGDIIQYARYIKHLNCHAILDCPESLHRLMLGVEGIKEVIDRDEPLPPHDYHVLSLSLPFVFGLGAKVPYICAKPMELEGKFKVGIAWEGSPMHENNNYRNCHLKYFRKVPGKLFMLPDELYDDTLFDEEVELYGVGKRDFQDIAELIAAMDVVVCVDTAVLHLAGAMGKMGYGLLAFDGDCRWKVENWYPSLKFIKQPVLGDWQSVFDTLVKQPEFS